jgi:hypothetical protein
MARVMSGRGGGDGGDDSWCGRPALSASLPFEPATRHRRFARALSACFTRVRDSYLTMPIRGR